MVKKLGIGLFVVILAFFTFICIFISIQKGEIEEKLTALLQENKVLVDEAKLNLLPLPNFRLKNVQYDWSGYQGKAEILDANLALWDLIQGKFPIYQVQIINGDLFNQQKQLLLQQIQLKAKVANLALSVTDLFQWFEKMHSTKMNLALEFMGQTAEKDRIQLATNLFFQPREISFSHFNGKLAFQQKRFFNQEKLQLNFNEGTFQFLDNDVYRMHFDSVQLNQQYFDSLLGEMGFSNKMRQNFTAVFQTQQNSQTENFSLTMSPSKNLEFRGKNMAIGTWLDIFNIPTLMTGRADITADLKLKNTLPAQGTFHFELNKGVIKALNILNLVKQFVPVNFDENMMANNETEFDKIMADFRWMPEMLNIEHFGLTQKYVTVKGKGKADLQARKCDFSTEVSATDPNYSKFTLPIRFFGDCHSPEYKVDFQRGLKEGLKEFIREKLK